MITFEPLFAYMDRKQTSIYKLVKDNACSNQTLVNMRLHPDKGISTKTINKICNYLRCKPSDIMRYIPDKDNQGPD